MKGCSREEEASCGARYCSTRVCMVVDHRCRCKREGQESVAAPGAERRLPCPHPIHTEPSPTVAYKLELPGWRGGVAAANAGPATLHSYTKKYLIGSTLLQWTQRRVLGGHPPCAGPEPSPSRGGDQLYVARPQQAFHRLTIAPAPSRRQAGPSPASDGVGVQGRRRRQQRGHHRDVAGDGHAEAPAGPGKGQEWLGAGEVGCLMGRDSGPRGSRPHAQACRAAPCCGK